MIFILEISRECQKKNCCDINCQMLFFVSKIKICSIYFFFGCKLLPLGRLRHLNISAIVAARNFMTKIAISVRDSCN
jgi:hypothetical protein